MQNRVLVSRRGWIAFPLALLLALVLSSGLAFAGGIRFQDDAGLLTSSDRSSLQSVVSSIRPNVLIITSKSYTNKQQFQNYVVNSLPDQNSVVIGVSNSSSLHTTVVKAGNNTGINDSEATSSASVGDNYFKNSDWRGGLTAIVQQVGRSASVPSSSNPGTATSTSSSGGGLSTLLCLGIGFIALVAISIFFFSRRGRSGPTIIQQPGPNYGPGYGPGPGYGGPGYGGGYGPGYNQGGGSGLGAGLGGAALGGLIGYELGKNSNDHNPGYNPGFNQGGGVSDWGNNGGDQGGGLGSSDWGNSGGGSSDWGSSGGGSDFGGGGGGDFGGGDFGAGGGGGDSSW